MLSWRALSGMQADVESFIDTVKQKYYVEGVAKGLLQPALFEETDGGRSCVPKAGWDAVVFASRPGSGGAVLKL